MDQEDMPRYRPPPNFCQMLRASGGGWETWRHADEDIKMHQFGWKSTTDESGYTPGTLIGNWNEERWDIKELMKVKTLPSQHAHYYETIYDTYYNKLDEKPPASLANLAEMRPKAFPSHQSDLDHPTERAMYNSWATTSRESFVHPDVRRTPLAQHPGTHERLARKNSSDRQSAAAMCRGPIGMQY